MLRRVPALVAFGEFARMRGSVPADLPAHVDAFVAMRVASFRRGREAAAEIHGGIEQMLAVAPLLDIPASDIGNTYLSDGHVLL